MNTDLLSLLALLESPEDVEDVSRLLEDRSDDPELQEAIAVIAASLAQSQLEGI